MITLGEDFLYDALNFSAGRLVLFENDGYVGLRNDFIDIGNRIVRPSLGWSACISILSTRRPAATTLGVILRSWLAISGSVLSVHAERSVLIDLELGHLTIQIWDLQIAINLFNM